MALFVIFFYSTKLLNIVIPEGFQIFQVAVLWVNQLSRKPQNQRPIIIEVLRVLTPLLLGQFRFAQGFPRLVKYIREQTEACPCWSRARCSGAGICI